MPMVMDFGRYVDYPDIVTDVIGQAYFGPGKVEENGLRLDKKKFAEVCLDKYVKIWKLD